MVLGIDAEQRAEARDVARIEDEQDGGLHVARRREHDGGDDVLRRAERLDLAILSVGTMAPSSTAFRFNLISDEERAELLKLGAVGDMLFNFYDRDGRLVDHPVNRRIMSLPLEQLRSVPTRVLASGGNDKVDALLGAIRLADANVLITNEATARELLLRKA